MKKLTVLVLMMLFVSCLLFPQTGAIAATVGGSISGTVRDSTTQAALAGVSVSIYIYEGNSGSLIAVDTTDATGAFTVTGLPAGNYWVKFDGWAVAHGTQWYNNKLDESDADIVAVTVGNTTSLAEALLPKTGVISGMVKDRVTQAGIAHIRVLVYDSQNNCISDEEVTGETGTYAVNNLPTGSYRVKFDDGTRFVDGNYYNKYYAPQWYNNKTDNTIADAVAVTVGNITTLNDALLDVGGKITGKVKDAATQTGIGMYIIAYDSQNNEQVAGIYSDYWDVGSYTVSGLAAGNYTLEFRSDAYVTQWYNNKSSWNTADPVAVTLGNTVTLADTMMVERGKISGKVKDSATQAGIAGIKVYVSYDGYYNANSPSATTDAMGAYTVTDLDTGSYKVKFDSGTTSYVSQWYNGKADANTADAVAVTAANTTILADALLTTGATLTGKVKDKVTQAGVAGVYVRVYDSQSGSNVASVATDGTGAYTVAGLVAGNYKVQYDTGWTDYVQQWYNNKLSQADADSVSVTAGNTTTLADAMLVMGGKISGMVRDGVTKTGVAGIAVFVYVSQSDFSNFVAVGHTDATGSYTVRGLPTGSYKILFNPWADYLSQWYNNKATMEAADPVAVTLGNTTTLADALLVMGGKITVKVKDKITQAALFDIGVNAIASDGSDYYGDEDYETGTYTITGLPTGTYKVRFEGWDGIHISQWYNNKQDINDNDKYDADNVAVTLGNTTALDDVLMEEPGTITGKATDAATQAGIAGIRVYVVNAENNALAMNPSDPILTDAAGVYTVTGLPSRSYKLLFSGGTTGYVSQWNEHKADRGGADPVALAAPETVTVDATLTAGGSIAGTVTDVGGTPLAGISVTVLDSNDISVSWASTDSSGNYLVKGLPSGGHKVRFTGFDKGYVTKYYGGDINPAQAESVIVKAPQQTGGINASLESGGSISGKVTDANGDPLAFAAVQAYDTASSGVSSTTTAEDGSYTLKGIPVGVFKVVVYSYSPISGNTKRWYGGTGSFAAATEITAASGAAITGIDIQLGTGPGIYFGGDSKDFGTVPLNSKTAYRTFSIYNYGTEKLAIGTLALSGENAAEFTLQNDGCSGKSVAPTGFCTFRIFLSPTTAALKSADITIPSNDPDSPALVIHAKGTGLATGSLSLTPAGLYFGTVPVGSSSTPQSATFTNDGPGSVTVYAAELTGDATQFPDYVGGTGNCPELPHTFAPGESCQPAFTFSPTSAGEKTATLVISSDAMNAPTLVLKGNQSDIIGPVVDEFAIPPSSTSATVAITTLSASDNVGVIGYLLSESGTTPGMTDTSWTATKPATYTFSGIPDGIATAKTLYAWVKDASGNVSAGKSAVTTITLPDVTKPEVESFTLPALTNSLNVTGIALAASDNVAVTGYLLSESATTPPVSAAGWNAAKPTGYTFTGAGVKTLYAFAKDGAGNISAAKSAGITIDTTPPTLVLSTLANGSKTINNTLNVSGTVTDNIAVASLTINGTAIAVKTDGSFTHAVTLVSGDNIITTVAKDTANNQASDVRTINLDLTAPQLTITTPADNSKTSLALAQISGTVDESATVVVKSTLNGSQNAVMNGTSFNATVNLESGLNSIDITATDLVGNSGSAKRTVTYDPLKPTLAVTSPDHDVTIYEGKITVAGTVSDSISGIADVVITAAGNTYHPAFTGGTFSQEVSFSDEKLYAVVVTVTDAAGNSESVTRNVIFIKGTIVINGGALYTVSPKVTLSLGFFPSAAQMQLYYNGKAWTKPEPFAESKIISLPKGDGLKTVQVRYLDASGTSLGEYTASITMDTVMPGGTVKINNGALLTNNRTVSLEIIAADATSGISRLCLKEDKLPCSDTDFEPFVTTKEYVMTSPLDGKKTVYATLKDLAGKSSKPLKATITLDTTAPTGSIVINGGKPATATPLVALKLKAVKASEMQLSLDGGASWGGWEKMASSRKVTLPAGAGEKVVKARFRDLAGNVSPDYEDSIMLQ